jgi:DNA polymerase-4
MRTLLHADMDAFFASVEQRDSPELRGRPVVVGGSSPRGVVAAASYEARVYGIHSAMPSVEACRLCPEVVFVRGDMAKYKRESRRIFEIFRRFTPLVEGLSLDEAFLDLTGTERLLGPAEAAARRLRAEVHAETHLTVSVGVAPVKLLAKIASDLAKPDGLLVVPRDGVREFLNPLPVGRVWGVGPVAQQKLARLGITTIGELADTPDAELRQVLGSWGPQAARLARGCDLREVTPYREAKSYGEENTFAEDVSNPEALRAAISAHSESVARRLRRNRVRGRRVTLKLKLGRRLGRGRYPLLTRSLTLLSPTDDGRMIRQAALDLLNQCQLAEAVRLVGVSVSLLEVAGFEQLPLLPTEFEDPRRRRLNRVVDAVQERYGRRALARGFGPVERAGLSSQIKRGEDPTT